MTAALGLYGAAAARDRGVLQPLAALAFALLGVFAYEPNDVDGTWALTALLTFPLTAWLVGAVLRSMPVAHREMLCAAVGGARAADAVTAVAGALLAVAVTAAWLAFPLAVGAFDRPVGPDDVAWAALAHLSCGALGAQLGRIAVPPVVARPATATGVVIAAMLVSVAAASAAGPVGGPMAVADGYADGTRGGLALACAACLALTAALEPVRRGLVRRRD